MTLQIVTAKFYEKTFGINEKTARNWYRDDLEALGRQRLTYEQFKALYIELTPIGEAMHRATKNR